jgi:hypothetical protein
LKRERVSCDPFEEPEMQVLKRKKERRVIGKCGSNVGWIQESWGVWEEGRFFRKREKRMGRAQKKSFGLGVGPTFGAVLVRRT